MVKIMFDKLKQKIRELESNTVDILNEYFGIYSPTFMIYGIHIKRLGLFKTTFGGTCQYLSLPLVIISHLNVLFNYNVLLKPKLNLPELDWNKYFVLDRHKIESLGLFDRFNCIFCGYANGMITLLNNELNNLEKSNLSKMTEKSKSSKLIMLINLANQIASCLYLMFIWEILISKPLQLKTISLTEAYKMITNDKFGENLELESKITLKTYKAYALYFDKILEQIESQWCPVKHLGIGEFPKHHEYFFNPNKLNQMTALLTNNGTVIRKLQKQ